MLKFLKDLANSKPGLAGSLIIASAAAIGAAVAVVAGLSWILR